MSLTDVLQFLFWIALGLLVGWSIVFGYWRFRSELKRRVDGDAPLRSRRSAIWRDPGSIAPAELEAGPSGPRAGPAPRFHFVEEHDTGSRPCVSVRDSAGRDWRVKWGQEVHTETPDSNWTSAAWKSTSTRSAVRRSLTGGARGERRRREETDLFTASLRARLDQLRQAADATAP